MKTAVLYLSIFIIFLSQLGSDFHYVNKFLQHHSMQNQPLHSSNDSGKNCNQECLKNILTTKNTLLTNIVSPAPLNVNYLTISIFNSFLLLLSFCCFFILPKKSPSRSHYLYTVKTTVLIR